MSSDGSNDRPNDDGEWTGDHEGTDGPDVTERLDRLERVIERQQAIIEAQRRRIEALEANGVAGRPDPTARDRDAEADGTPAATDEPRDGDETGGGSSAGGDSAPGEAGDEADDSGADGEGQLSLTRRAALAAAGTLGLFGASTGTAAADPQGRVGTARSPAKVVHTERLAGGLTGGTVVDDLLGTGLTTAAGEESTALSAAPAADDHVGVVGDFGLEVESVDRFELAGALSAEEREPGVVELEATDDVIQKSSSGGALTDDDGDTLLEPVDGQVAGLDGFETLQAPGALTLNVDGGTRALALAPGGSAVLATGSGAATPNVFLGNPNNSSLEVSVTGATVGGGGTQNSPNDVTANFGTISGGVRNSVGGVGAAVGGGGNNAASERQATVGGGVGNSASANWATVGGGDGNTAGAQHATVGGGQNNTASGFRSFVGGGDENEATGDDSTVGGGVLNDATGIEAVIGGGDGNTASAENATVGGGAGNTAGGVESTVSGGAGNSASAENATVGGGAGNTAGGVESTVGGGSGNSASGLRSFVGGGSGNSASGTDAAVGSGAGNTAGGNQSTVGGGSGNSASGTDAAVGGGAGNTAGSNRSTVGGGSGNSASGLRSFVGGGSGNSASGTDAAVGGGAGNTAGGNKATIGGGNGNTASGVGATVPGGEFNDAGGDRGFAAGQYAAANDANAFVWNDGSGATDATGSATDQFGSGTDTNATATPTGPNTFSVKATGGVRFVTSADNTSHAWVDTNGNVEASGAKNFVQTVSTDGGERTVTYTALEAPTARTEVSGVVTVTDGSAEVDLPDHFDWVTDAGEELVVQVTPHAKDPVAPRVVDRSTDRIRIADDGDGPASYEVSWTVKGTREGYADKTVVADPDSGDGVPADD